MKTFTNKNGEKVTLTGKSAVNSLGNKLLWVRCENGATVSIFEKEFNTNFK